ncbi:MAG: DUF2892 domain-containing protein [Chloroflexota bacterium]|nr:DUF2892 domain-containing protein [Chloroflexota bacterium]
MSAAHDFQRTGRGAGGPSVFGVRRPAINITPVERVGRVAVGLLVVIAGALLLAAAGSALVIALEVLLVLAGLDLAVTGALGHCPLYKKLGFVPRSLRGAAS